MKNEEAFLRRLIIQYIGYLLKNLLVAHIVLYEIRNFDPLIWNSKKRKPLEQNITVYPLFPL